MRPGTKTSRAESEQDLAEKHVRTLLRALQVAHPVLLEGRERFVQVLTARLIGDRIETEIYLTGAPGPFHADELSLAPRPAEENARGST